MEVIKFSKIYIENSSYRFLNITVCDVQGIFLCQLNKLLSQKKRVCYGRSHVTINSLIGHMIVVLSNMLITLIAPAS